MVRIGEESGERVSEGIPLKFLPSNSLFHSSLHSSFVDRKPKLPRPGGGLQVAKRRAKNSFHPYGEQRSISAV